MMLWSGKKIGFVRLYLLLKRKQFCFYYYLRHYCVYAPGNSRLHSISRRQSMRRHGIFSEKTVLNETRTQHFLNVILQVISKTFHKVFLAAVAVFLLQLQYDWKDDVLFFSFPFVSYYSQMRTLRFEEDTQCHMFNFD